MINGYYILKGKSIIHTKDVLVWARYFEKSDRIIKQEELPNGYFVSTVFLGLDHNFGIEGEPLLFETMVFKGRSREEMTQDRCSTYNQAVKIHKEKVFEWSKK